jgi:hypothetical protein
MKKIINNLRQQPEEVRKHVLHVTTFVVTVLLFFVWVFTLGRTLSSAENKANMQTELEPISTMTDNFINGYNSLVETE